MNLRSITTRTAVAGAVTALAAGALVGAGPTRANAATAATNYTCSAPGMFSDTFAMHIDVQLLPPSAPAGFPIGEGVLGFDASLTIPAGTAALLPAAINGGKSDDYMVSFGTEGHVEAPVVFTERTANEDGSATFTGTGSNKPLILPGAGTYVVAMPETFTMEPTASGSPLGITVTCTSDAPGSLGSVTLTKQASETVAKAPKPVKKTQKAKVTVKVTNEYAADGGAPVSGKVTAKEGKKVVGTATVKNGKAVITLKKLKPGTHTVVVSYGGDQFTDKSAAPAIKVKVKK